MNDASWRKYAVAVAVVAVAGAMISVFVSSSATRQYEAVVMLKATPSKLGDGPAAPIDAATFVPVLRNPESVAAVLKTLKLDARGWTVGTFQDQMQATPLGGTALIDFRVRLDTPELAAQTANALADRAVQQSRQLGADEASGAREQLEAQMKDARQRYEESLTALETFRRGAQIEMLRKDVEAMLNERLAMVDTALKAEAQKALIGSGEAELAKRPRIDEITRSIDRNAAMLEAARSAGTGAGGVLDLRLKEQQINKAHEELDIAVATARGALAALERRYDRASRVAGAEGQAKLTKLYQAERTLAQRETDVAVTHKAYEQAATQFESARLQVSTRSGALQILSRAYPPERGLSRHVVMNAVLVFSLVIGAGVLVGFGVASLKKLR